MITLTDVWKRLAGSNTVPRGLPKTVLQAISIDPKPGGAERLLIVLPDHLSPEAVNRALAHGVVGIVAEGRFPSAHNIVWFDTTEPGGANREGPIEGLVGFIVPHAQMALLELAKLWRSKSHAQIVCILGAEGLRTTQRVTRSVLGQRFQVAAPDILCCDTRSTAQALFAIRPDVERLLLRMSLHDAEGLNFLKEVVCPHVVVVNNMFPAHSGGSQQNLWFEEHLPDALAPDALLIINADDPVIETISLHSSATVFGYGLQAQPSCALWTSRIESEGREGLRLRMHYKGETIHVRIPLLGRYSVHTALAASAVGLISGESWDEIVAGLRTMTAQLHLILTPGINGAFFLEDSYAADSASTLSILNLLEEFPGRKIAVLGDMLELAYLEVAGHKKVGRRVVDTIAYLVTVGKLGRIIGQEAIECGMTEASVYMASDNQDAAEKLKGILGPEDIVLVCGAGQLGLKEIVDELIDTQASLCEV